MSRLSLFDYAVLLTAMVESMCSCSLRILSPSFSFSSALMTRVCRMTCGIIPAIHEDCKNLCANKYLKKSFCGVFPADLQILLHLFQRLHFVLGMASLQQTVTAHVQPLVGAVVTQDLRVCRASPLGEVP